MPLYYDQIGRKVSIPLLPKRIVSLVPSQTELLFHLGLQEEVVGITKFCIHPEHWFRTKGRVGGTKNVHLDAVREIKPDLIIANKEENVQEQVEVLAEDFPVWVSDVNNLEEALVMIQDIGDITGKANEARKIIDQISTGFQSLNVSGKAIPTAYLIWKDPYMAAAGGTFIDDLLTKGGFRNVFNNSSRYPAVTAEAIRQAGAEVLMLSSEPYPFKQIHIDELQQLLPDTKIVLVDGELFSWYGSRLLHTPAYFAQLQKQLHMAAD